MEPIISGIQQVGVGVPDVREAQAWYSRVLGFDIPIFDDPGVADRMQRYTGGQPQSRHAVLTVNLQGGGGLELWQYTSRTPQPPAFQVLAGDLGIFLLRLKTQHVEKAYLRLKETGADILGTIVTTPEGVRALCLRDPYGNLIRLEESTEEFAKTPAINGGVLGVSVGVTDIQRSVRFYKEILGYDKTLYDGTGAFLDMHPLPGGTGIFRRVLLGHSKPREGAFAKLLGFSTIELIQCLDRTPNKIFENRYWGDLGYIQVCYDIRGMAALKALCAEKGYPLTVESNPETADKKDTFDMGEASGIFSYAEDPDGTLIEFVETHRLPVMKKLGWYLDLRKRDPKRPLPDWMLKALRFNRKKL